MASRTRRPGACELLEDAPTVDPAAGCRTAGYRTRLLRFWRRRCRSAGRRLRLLPPPPATTSRSASRKASTSSGCAVARRPKSVRPRLGSFARGTAPSCV
uniref:Uncharacterized protein n=1 Tax=Macrostomum lignano TaxID=282301 RepID=A0A1I8F327_9PLAT